MANAQRDTDETVTSAANVPFTCSQSFRRRRIETTTKLKLAIAIAIGSKRLNEPALRHAQSDESSFLLVCASVPPSPAQRHSGCGLPSGHGHILSRAAGHSLGQTLATCVPAA